MKAKSIVQASLFVALLGSLGFNYMFFKIIASNKQLREIEQSRTSEILKDLDRTRDAYYDALNDNERLKGKSGEAFSSQYGSERDNQRIINSELGGEMEVVLDCGSRVDLVFELEDQKSFNMVACEVDWANKWAEGIGQSIYYWLKLNDPIIRKVKEEGASLNPRALHRPLVILLAKGNGSGWEKYRDRVEFVGKFLPRPGLTCWVFDAETKTWLDKE